MVDLLGGGATDRNAIMGSLSINLSSVFDELEMPHAKDLHLPVFDL